VPTAVPDKICYNCKHWRDVNDASQRPHKDETVGKCSKGVACLKIGHIRWYLTCGSWEIADIGGNDNGKV